MSTSRVEFLDVGAEGVGPYAVTAGSVGAMCEPRGLAHGPDVALWVALEYEQPARITDLDE